MNNPSKTIVIQRRALRTCRGVSCGISINPSVGYVEADDTSSIP
jgi:hypothetical protein